MHHRLRLKGTYLTSSLSALLISMQSNMQSKLILRHTHARTHAHSLSISLSIVVYFNQWRGVLHFHYFHFNILNIISFFFHQKEKKERTKCTKRWKINLSGVIRLGCYPKTLVDTQMLVDSWGKIIFLVLVYFLYICKCFYLLFFHFEENDVKTLIKMILISKLRAKPLFAGQNTQNSLPLSPLSPTLSLSLSWL